MSNICDIIPIIQIDEEISLKDINLKINNLFILGGSLVMVTSSLIGAHLFAGSFLYFIATSAVESYKLGKEYYKNVEKKIKNK